MKMTLRTLHRRVAVALALLEAWGVVTGDEEPGRAKVAGALTIVTPYPGEMTRVFQHAFQQRHPAVNVRIIKKKTGDALSYLQRIAKRNTVDLIWASAPATFEILKGKGLLEPFQLSALDLPGHLGSYPLHDPQGFFVGFAGSGYGMMWNKRYLKAKQLPVPAAWPDLAQPVYAGHVGMSSPARSGTTHVIVESILQQYGWEQGWQLLLAIAANLQRVTANSYAVPVGVRDGEFGVGLVIDFYGLSVKARYYPVDFAYPERATLLPASIAIVKNAPNEAAALAFIHFMLSPEGQVLLLNKEIRRLPVRPEVYRSAPSDYPDPHRDEWLRNTLAFDVALSTQRYHLVNALFDVMITSHFEALVAASRSLTSASAMLADRPDDTAAQIIEEARALLSPVPLDESRALDTQFSGLFIPSAAAQTAREPPMSSAQWVSAWSAQVGARYQRAKQLADSAAERLAQVPARVE